MENFDFAIQNMLESEKQGSVFAKFYSKFVKTGIILENGLPEYQERLYVEIRTRGDSDIVDRPADESDIRRFSREYNFYIAKKERMKTGTPLNQFAFLSVPQIESCNMRGVCTVEDLANMTDAQALELNLTNEKQCAVKFLELSKNNAIIQKYEDENKKLKDEIAKLKDELKAIKEDK